MLHVAPIQWPAWHWHSTIETPRGHNNSNHNNSNNNNSNNNNSNNNDSNNNDRNHEATASTDSASRCDRSDRRLPRYWGLGPVAKPRKQFHFYFPFFFVWPTTTTHCQIFVVVLFGFVWCFFLFLRVPGSFRRFFFSSWKKQKKKKKRTCWWKRITVVGRDETGWNPFKPN